MDVSVMINMGLSAVAIVAMGAVSLWGRRRRIREALDRELERILADA